ncbi:ABC transporter ATP-binding protein [Pantoea sp. Acro-805]|uniref:ABC-type xenobiotic transporter n=1 Tax=Candidatus Pantoea formicae TaxID=2608355 RepID=A0ABX0QQB4_9GAMM|nr:ABC transporter ATP-binding protein [Pantoea formicae]NIE99252.1 ABC transporter ATP-binding protein [Pantoea formicae]
MSLINRVLSQPSAGRSQLLTGMLCRFLAQLCMVLPFFIAWWGIAKVTTSHLDALFWGQLAAVLLLCLAGQLVFSHIGQLRCFLGSYQLMHDVRETTTDKLRHLPLGYFQRKRLGETSTLLTDAMRRVEEIFSHLLPEVIAGLATSLIFLLGLTCIDLRLTLALVVTLPPAVLLMWWMGKRLLMGTQQQGARFVQASGLLLEFISGIRTLRLYHRAGPMVQRLDESFAAIRRASMGIEAWGGGSVQLFRLLMECGVVLLFLMAAHLFQLQEISLLTWLLFVLVAVKVIDPLLEAAAYFTLLRVMQQSASRIDALMAQPGMPEQGTRDLTPQNDIAFEKVSFAYQDDEVVKDISFRVPEGSVTAIVGTSGSGKSTLLHLLGGFWPIATGEITLGSVPLQSLGSEQIYSRIGYVFQDVQLFDGSVMDNVRIGRPEASDEAVRAACHAAHCDDFISRLPQGYDTPLGEGAQRLSGGERQRLSIARMMLKNPPIIVLDEATALLDPLSQAEVQQALTQLAKGKTVVMVAHRLRTVEFASQILVLEKGRIVQSGVHQELVKRPGLYRELWTAQEGES